MSSVISILQFKLALEKKLHESKSLAQAKLMQAVAHNPEFAEKVDIPQEVGKEFVEADKKAHEQPEQAERPLPVWLELNGLPIAIENQAGTVRSGIDENGNEWSIQLQDHYGEIRETIGADGDGVDCFINPDYDNFNEDLVFVIKQVNPITGVFDEDKVMLGYNDLAEAENAYMRNYEEGWQGLGEIVQTTYESLIDNLEGFDE